MRGTERPGVARTEGGKGVARGGRKRQNWEELCIPTYCIRIDCFYPQSNRKTLCFKQKDHMSRFTSEKIIMAIG